MPSFLVTGVQTRSEEHTSELQSHDNLVCRLLLEKKHTRAGSSQPPLDLAQLLVRRPRQQPRRVFVAWRVRQPGDQGGADHQYMGIVFFLINGAPPKLPPFPLPPAFPP